MPTTLKSFAKINLGLAVGPPRPDGFHALVTVYQTVDLYDLVRVKAQNRRTPTQISLHSNHPEVPRTETGDAERNTAYRMVAGALERMRISAAVEIEIEKRLPVQGGMGAGSANAAAALLGLERELGVALPGPERLRLAAEVGSDVPLFLIGGTVLGVGRGEEVYPLPDLPRTECVVAVPSVGVSTAQAFRDLDARASPEGINPLSSGRGYGTSKAAPVPSGGEAVLTFAQGGDKLMELSRVLASVWTKTGAESGLSGITWAGNFRGDAEGTAREGDLAENPLLALVRTGIENDFEEVAFSQHPSLRSTKRDLMGTELAGSALYAALSGSGSALFGLYSSQADAREAQQRVQNASTQALLTETLTRPEYWARMFAE